MKSPNHAQAIENDSGELLLAVDRPLRHASRDVPRPQVVDALDRLLNLWELGVLIRDSAE